MSGVLVGEGAYLTDRVPVYRPAAHVELLLGAIVGVSGVLLSRASPTRRAAALVLGAVVAGTVLFAYTAPTLVL